MSLIGMFLRCHVLLKNSTYSQICSHCNSFAVECVNILMSIEITETTVAERTLTIFEIRKPSSTNYQHYVTV